MRQLRINQKITDRSSKSLTIYLKEVAHYDILAPEKEAELFHAYKNGDKKAKELLIKSNLRFVISVAKQYITKGIDVEDLISEGNIGLLTALASFDETKGFKFCSYAVWWIRQYISNAVTNNSRMIRLPASQVNLLSKLQKAIQKFEQTNFYTPSIEELAYITEIDPIVIYKVLFNQPISTNTTVSGDVTIEGVLQSSNITDADLEKEDFRNIVDRLLNNLKNERDKQIIKYYYGIDCEPHSLESISELIGLCRERCRQVILKNKRFFKQLLKESKYNG